MDNVPHPSNLQTAWAEITQAIRSAVSPDTFDRWFKGISLVSLDKEQLTLAVPNDIYQYWIESNYLSLLQSATTVALGSPRAVRFVLGEPAVKGTPCRPPRRPMEKGRIQNQRNRLRRE